MTASQSRSIMSVTETLQDILTSVQDTYDGMSEAAQDGEKGDRLSDEISALEEALSALSLIE